MTKPRAYQIERDRFGLMYSGPDVVVGEMREVYEKSHVDAERERMLDLLKVVYDAASSDSLDDVWDAVDAIGAILTEHGRLSGGEA